MCGIKQLSVPQAAEGTLMSVCLEYTFAECSLVQPSARQRSDILPAGLSNSAMGRPRSLSEKQYSKRYASLVECKDVNNSTTKSRLL